MITGQIKTLNQEKGYGFIKDSNGGEFFFHISGLTGCYMRDLKPGMKVTFEKVNSPKGLRAENVSLVE
jgi:CspA family cold shock protein